jgi:6-phosphogluconate dehydrogenase
MCPSLTDHYSLSDHYKMVHNGIEYAMMQSIAEAYDLMYRGMGLSNDNISSIFSEWNNGVLNSYLVKITSKVLRIKKDGMALIDSIVDKSMQKGTGKDFAICAFKYDIAAPTITEAVNARFLSNVDRGNLSKLNSFFLENNGYDNSSIIECIQDSIYCSYVASIIQGFDLIRAVSSDYSWNIDAKKVFSIWSEGCIIKSSILDNLSNNINENNLLDLFLQSMSKDRVKNLRSVVLFSSQCGAPVPVGSATLAYYLGVSSEKLPSNLIQLQREYFGSHGFEIFDKPGVINHLNNEDI